MGLSFQASYTFFKKVLIEQRGAGRIPEMPGRFADFAQDPLNPRADRDFDVRRDSRFTLNLIQTCPLIAFAFSRR